MKNAASLVALAAVAFRKKDFENAGALFVHAMASDDVEEFVESLSESNDVLTAVSSVLSEIPSDDFTSMSLASAAGTLSLSMNSQFTANLRQEFRSDIEDDLFPVTSTSSDSQDDDNIDFHEDDDFESSSSDEGEGEALTFDIKSPLTIG